MTGAAAAVGYRSGRARIMVVATVPAFLLHNMRSQIESMVASGYAVTLVASPDEHFARLATLGAVDVIGIRMPRKISPWVDCLALWRLHAAIRRVRPSIVHSTTPKGGLLCAIAGRLAGVPVRLHTFTGQVWTTLSGPVRVMARLADRLIVRLSTTCYCDSPSQRDYLESQGIARPGRIGVLGDGSLSGVDLSRFSPERAAVLAATTRARLGIGATEDVVVFVGRVTRDKGVVELAAAFTRVRAAGREARLLLVGPLDNNVDALPASEQAWIAALPGVIRIPYDPQPEQYLSCATVFCLPSYREGFPTVVLEAAALAIPAIGTRITGMTDTIVDGETGLLVPARDVPALADAMLEMMRNPERRNRMARAARARVERQFTSDRLSRLLLAEYDRLLVEHQVVGDC